MSIAAALMMLAAPPQYAGAPVSDPVLDSARGGFQLPNGIDVAITVQTQTAVDGAVVLRTVFQADQGKPTLSVYVPKPGEVVAAPTTGSNTAGGQSLPTVTYDRQGGLQVTQATSMPALSVGVSNGAAASETPSGLTAVDALRGATTDAGVVSRTDRAGIDTVRLESADLSITHFAGNAFGSAIANSGSDRAIDTATTISIGLSNAGPDVLGSAMLRVQDIAGEAIRGRF